MADLLEYKCPCCGGAISFDTSTQKLKCPYCDTEFDVETLRSYDADLKKDTPDDINWKKSEEQEWQDGEAEGMRVYVCDSCGGEIICDENTAATSCPYCGNPVVMKGNLKGLLKPDYIIPFKLDKKAAKARLFEHFKGKRLLPKVFKQENHIDEIKGVYVPFWLFDSDVDADIRYRAESVRYWEDSENNYTETSYYSVYRSGNISFAKVPVDGSSKMADDLMESVEPFDFNEAKEFATAYLAGYMADKYDVDAEKSFDRAGQRVKHSTEEEFAKTVIGYDRVNVENSSVRVSDGVAKYAMYPVWILNTTWKNQKFTFAMNGQTGKFVGNLPLDKGAFWRWFLCLGSAISGVVFLILYLIYLLG